MNECLSVEQQEADSEYWERNKMAQLQQRQGQIKIMGRQLEVVVTLRGLKYPKAAVLSRDDVL